MKGNRRRMSIESRGEVNRDLVFRGPPRDKVYHDIACSKEETQVSKTCGEDGGRKTGK